ncbi:MAG: ferredoxin [Candidatus Aenigmatarchaeota archaeon]
MTKFKVSLDANQCIGCGACTNVCADNFEIGKDGKAHVKKDVSEDECNVQAADICPVQCIVVKKM